MNDLIISASGEPRLTGTTIVIGAGAAGLLAARELSALGQETILLEAGSEPGGRIRTVQENGFPRPVEAGAEFVHGKLPLTLQLLKEAGISCRLVKGEMINVRKGKWTGQGLFTKEWGEMMQRMQELGKDMPMAEFLSTRFPGEKYAGLRDSVKRFAGGYDLADIQTVSTKTLYREWQQEEEEVYRIEGGYGRLIHFLTDECRAKGCRIYLSSPVKKITWEKGRVQVLTVGGAVFTGSRAIITVSLGVLQLSSDYLQTGPPTAGSALIPDCPAAIQFSPAIGDYLQAAGKLGYGEVIKILLQFKQPFWNKRDEKIGFILSDEEIPTWWTQFPDENPLLTGWLTGSARKSLQKTGQTELIDRCLSSLASIFAMDAGDLKEQLVAAKIMDWSAEPYVRGGYSFDMVGSDEARKLLLQPVEQTLFFAGEALYEGMAPATVEAALASGKEVAGKIIARS